MTSLVNGTIDTEPYVIGLLLFCIFLSAIPGLATGTIIFAGLLCLIVWTGVYSAGLQGTL